MENQKQACCLVKKRKDSRGIWSGVLFGLLPHSFCLAFIVFSVIGSVAITAFFKKALLAPNFLFFLIALSFVLATISALIYLKQKDCLCLAGVKSKWKYLLSVYLSIIGVNLLMFFVVFPAVANLNTGKALGSADSVASSDLAMIVVKTKIPCSGHAPLIIDELKQTSGVYSVTFSLPNTFNIVYEPLKISPSDIISKGALKTYQATIN